MTPNPKICLINIVFYCLFAIYSFAQKVVRGPYLQQVSTSEAIIRWRTDIPSNSMVDLMSAEGKVSISDAAISSNHIVYLKNLKPNTRYNYSIGYSGKIFVSAFYYFTTAPLSNKAVNIWAMGDFGDDSKEVYAKNQLAVKNSYLQKNNSPSDFWLWLGDNAYCCGTDKQYQTQVFDFYGEQILANTPFYPVPGNHEYLETATAQKDRKISYFDLISVPQKAEMGGVPSFSNAYYSFNYANIHLIALDSYGLDEGLRLYDSRSKQYQWLIQDLEANKSDWTVVFFHHPPYTKRSHNSDGEEELRLIREGLVPIFDKYKVDLVLNGHSHIYERSFLMKGHTGKSPTFDYQTHVVQKVDGKYLKNGFSAPFINKSEGTVYAVVGSAGRLDWSGDPDPHVSSQYSNVSIGGSLLLTINQNRLDAKWLCADGEIRDEFTMFKNVNKTNRISVKYGEKVRLTASWEGSFVWSVAQAKQKTIEIQPLKDLEVSVVDSLGFLEDKFVIQVIPPPLLKTSLKKSENICNGSSIEASFELENAVLAERMFDLEISDANGSFSKKKVLGSTSKSPFLVALPKDLPEGNAYRVRFVPTSAESNYFLKESEAFQVNRLASGGFVQSTIPYDSLANLTYKFEGTFPIKLIINNLNEYLINKNEGAIQIKLSGVLVYRLTSLENVCGKGNVTLNEKVLVEAPLSIEKDEFSYEFYPNPVEDELYVKRHNFGNSGKESLIILDERGRLMNEFIGKIEKFSFKNYTPGVYYLIMMKEGIQTKSFKLLKR